MKVGDKRKIMEDEFLGHPVSSSPPFPPRKQKVRFLGFAPMNGTLWFVP